MRHPSLLSTLNWKRLSSSWILLLLFSAKIRPKQHIFHRMYMRRWSWSFSALNNSSVVVVVVVVVKAVKSIWNEMQRLVAANLTRSAPSTDFVSRMLSLLICDRKISAKTSTLAPSRLQHFSCWVSVPAHCFGHSARWTSQAQCFRPQRSPSNSLDASSCESVTWRTSCRHQVVAYSPSEKQAFSHGFDCGGTSCMRAAASKLLGRTSQSTASSLQHKHADQPRVDFTRRANFGMNHHRMWLLLAPSCLSHPRATFEYAPLADEFGDSRRVLPGDIEHGRTPDRTFNAIQWRLREEGALNPLTLPYWVGKLKRWRRKPFLAFDLALCLVWKYLRGALVDPDTIILTVAHEFSEVAPISIAAGNVPRSSSGSCAFEDVMDEPVKAWMAAHPIPHNDWQLQNLYPKRFWRPCCKST